MRCLALMAVVLCSVLLGGCGNARLPGLSRAGAPALHGDGDFRNTANPNAPYAGLRAQPKLVARPTLLDVNGVSPCDAARLSLFESEARSNGAHHFVRLTFANDGEACRLGGFPALTLLGADGSVLGAMHLEKVSVAELAATLEPAAQTAEESDIGAPSPQVLLPQNGGASFALGWTSGDICTEVARIAVGAPGATRPLLLSRTLRVCGDRVYISAIAPSE